jgi:hypothetical protein
MKKIVFIATPMYDEWVCMEHTAALLETGILLTSAGMGVYHGVFPGCPFLDLARNTIVDKFLESEATDLLFIDADVGWDPKMVTRVMSYPQMVVGGLVPKRNSRREDDFHQNALTGVVSKEGLFQSLEIPTAFVRIKREIFDRMTKPYFKIGSKPEDYGEDIYFCRRLCELGEYCWIDSDITFTHRGGKVWKGNFFDHSIKTGLLKQAEAA